VACRRALASHQQESPEVIDKINPGDFVRMSDLRELLHRSEQFGFLYKESRPLSVIYELAKVLKARDGKGAVIFENPVLPDGEISKVKVAGGLMNNRSLIAGLLNVEKEEKISARILEALRGRDRMTKEISHGRIPLEEEPSERMDVRTLPILKHYRGEGGRYVTSGIFIVHDKEGDFFSLSYHRMMVLGPREFAVRAVEGRFLYKKVVEADRSGKDLPVTVSIGSELGLMISAATPAEDVDRLDLAGRIQQRPVEIACMDEDLVIPARSEIVLVGRIRSGVRAKEGPFYEILGKDLVRDQPVFVVDRIFMREDPIYYAILPAGHEHELLMGLPVEAKILEEVSRYCKVKGVAMTSGGARWVEVAISIEKEFEGQAVLAALAAINAHRSLKRVIVVDSDVDVHDYESVMRAVNQRAHVPDDYIFIRNARGSSLDRSNLRYLNVEGRKLLVSLPQSKLIIDATIKGPSDFFKLPS